jgi:hypothetical protein
LIAKVPNHFFQISRLTLPAEAQNETGWVTKHVSNSICRRFFLLWGALCVKQLHQENKIGNKDVNKEAAFWEQVKAKCFAVDLNNSTGVAGRWQRAIKEVRLRVSDERTIEWLKGKP